jgi:glycosyltransferase 2 family protein
LKTEGQIAPQRGRVVRIVRLLSGFVISGAAVWLLTRNIDIGEIGAYLGRVDFRLLPIVLVFLVIVFWFKAVRWRFQLAPLADVTVRQCLSIIVISYTANNIFPLKGGDLLRAHLLSRRLPHGNTAVFATIMLERLLDVLAMVSLGSVVIFLAPVPLWISHSVLVVGVCAVGFVLAVVTVQQSLNLKRRLKQWGARYLPKRLRKPASRMMEQIFVGLSTARTGTRIVQLYGFALFELALLGITNAALFRMMGLDLSVTALMSTVVAADLAAMAPAAPANIGVFEFAVTTSLKIFDISSGAALSGAVVLHLLYVIPPAIAALCFWSHYWSQPKAKCA